MNQKVVQCSAEAAEADRISDKVRRKIDEADVLIALVARRHCIVPEGAGVLDRLRAALRIGKRKWSAPPWLLMETGYALGRNKKVVWFLEAGIEEDVGALQGDLEHVLYDPESPSSATEKASSILNKLLDSHLGVATETAMVRSEPEVITAAVPAERATQTEVDAESGAPLFSEAKKMFEAIHRHDWESAGLAFSRGMDLALREGEDEAIRWQIFYHSERYKAGAGEGLGALLELEGRYPSLPGVPSAIGGVYAHFPRTQRLASIL